MLLFGLGFIELAFFAVFLVLLIVGCSLDRDINSGASQMKWYVLLGGAAIIGIWNWSSWTLGGVWSDVASWTFWKPVGEYLVAGLVYSLVEFFFEIRRSAASFKEAWAAFLADTTASPTASPKTSHGPVYVTNASIIQAAQGGDDTNTTDRASQIVGKFIALNRGGSGVIGVAVSKTDPLAIEPVTRKPALIAHLSAWTFLWPTYMLSLVFGDLLKHVFTMIADVLVHISGHFVKFSFRDVFKV